MNKPTKSLVTENDVKAATKKMLKEEGALSFPYAAGGYGGIKGISDILACHKGRFIAIEAKRPGRRGEENRGLSAHQEKFGGDVLATEGMFFVVDDYESIEKVREKLRG